jgi:hypothetical protein
VVAANEAYVPPSRIGGEKDCSRQQSGVGRKRQFSERPTFVQVARKHFGVSARSNGESP